jgi:hypothetical protein
VPTLDPKPRFALIHHGSARRLAVIRPRLAGLASELGGEVREFHWQPDPSFADSTLVERFRVSRFSERLHRQHLRFRGRRRPPVTLGVSLREVVRCLTRRDGGQPFRSQLVEQVLTDKHVRAWTDFLDSPAEVLIVLEDDAVIADDTAARLRSVLGDARLDPGGLLYLDLAGGFPLRKLCEPDRLLRLDGGMVRTGVPFGNTTCGYALSRPLAAKMVTELAWRPELRCVGPDWLVNELLMRIHLRTPVDCVHTEPTILGHGSFLGTYESHIQARPAPKG